MTGVPTPQVPQHGVELDNEGVLSVKCLLNARFTVVLSYPCILQITELFLSIYCHLVRVLVQILVV